MTWQYGYDAMCRPNTVVGPNGLTTYIYHDSLCRPIQTQSRHGTTTFTHDAKGNVLTRTDARGKQTTYTYDSLDRVLTVTYPAGTGITLEYDGGPSGLSHQKGELTKITDASGSTSYGHDALGRVIGKTVVIGSKTFTVGYTWGDSGSALDKLTAIT